MSCVGVERPALITVSYLWYLNKPDPLLPVGKISSHSNCSFSVIVAGNRRFRHVISQSIDEYRAATSKWEKSLVAARLVSVIHQSGGRFLKQKKDNEDQWYELSSSESKSKVSHAIRDAIAATKPSRRSSHESTSSMKSDTKASTVPSSCSSSSATPMDDCSSSTAATTPMDDSSRMDDSSDSANGHSLARSRYRGTWSSNSLVSLSEADSDKEVATTKPDRPTSLRNEEWASSSDEDAAGSDYDGTDEFASYIHSVLGPAHP